MFDFEREFSSGSATKIVASESCRLSVEQRQRDVYESHRHRVFAVSYYMTANEVESEQLLTETFVSAFAKQAEPDATTVDRALVTQLEQRFSLDASEPAVPDRELMLSRTATRRTDLEEALGALPPRERLVFLLKDVEGYAVSRVGAVLDLSEKDVQRTLFSARIRMRNALAAVQRAAESQSTLGDSAYCESCESELANLAGQASA